MIDLDSRGTRLETTRAAQSPIERTPLRVLVPMAAGRGAGKQGGAYAFRSRTKRSSVLDSTDRLIGHATAVPGLLREAGSPGKLRGRGEAPEPKLQPATHAYRAYHGGLITARQARALGCVIDNAGPGRKVGASAAVTEPKPIAFDTAGAMPWTPKRDADAQLKAGKARNRRRHLATKAPRFKLSTFYVGTYFRPLRGARAASPPNKRAIRALLAGLKRVEVSRDGVFHVLEIRAANAREAKRLAVVERWRIECGRRVA